MAASFAVPDSSRLQVVHVFRKRRSVLLADYRTEVPFAIMYDQDGEETEDETLAVAAVALLNADLWVAIDFREWDETLH